MYDNRALTVYEIMLLTGLDDKWDSPTTNEKLIRDIIGEAVLHKLIYHLVIQTDFKPINYFFSIVILNKYNEYYIYELTCIKSISKTLYK